MTTLAAKESLPVVLVCHGLTARSILSRQVECPEAKITGKGALSVGNTSLTVIVMGEDGVVRRVVRRRVSKVVKKSAEGDNAAEARTEGATRKVRRVVRVKKRAEGDGAAEASGEGTTRKVKRVVRVKKSTKTET